MWASESSAVAAVCILRLHVKTQHVTPFVVHSRDKVLRNQIVNSYEKVHLKFKIFFDFILLWLMLRRTSYTLEESPSLAETTSWSSFWLW